MVNNLGASTLPVSLPMFVRNSSAIAEITALGPEEDRLKGSGHSWDSDYDPGHFVDLDDDYTIAGVLHTNALPESMSDYARALAAVNTDPYRQGYLPYSILDGWEQVRTDFAYWRVDNYLATHARGAATRAWFLNDRRLREALTLRDIGVWGHFVGDGSQPLHASIHFNGWGNYPNPNGYSTAKDVHARFEGAFVRDHVSSAEIRSLMSMYTPSKPSSMLGDSALLAQIGAYLRGSAQAVPQLYAIEKQHGFEKASPAAIAFTARQLARGADEFRDLIALAWEDSMNVEVGYPPIGVRAIVTGASIPNPRFFGGD